MQKKTISLSHRRHVQHRALLLRPDIVRLPDLPLEQHRLERLGDVLDEQVRARRAAVAVDRQRRATRGQERELGDELLRELVRAVDVVAAGDDARHLVRGHVGLLICFRILSVSKVGRDGVRFLGVPSLFLSPVSRLFSFFCCFSIFSVVLLLLLFSLFSKGPEKSGPEEAEEEKKQREQTEEEKRAGEEEKKREKETEGKASKSLSLKKNSEISLTLTIISAPALAAEYGLVGSSVLVSLHPSSRPTDDSP